MLDLGFVPVARDCQKWFQYNVIFIRTELVERSKKLQNLIESFFVDSVCHWNDTCRPALFQYWDAQTPPPEVNVLMKSWEEDQTFFYSKFDRQRSASFLFDYFDESMTELFLRCAVPAMQADFFRLFALYACGGLYVDADIKNLGSHVYLTEKDCYLFRRHGNVANDLMFFRRPRNAILRQVIEIVVENILARRPGGVWEISGPGVFNRVIENLTLTESSLLAAVEFDRVERLRTHVQFCWKLDYKETDSHWVNADKDKNYIA